jgi:hypothetical protein
MTPFASANITSSARVSSSSIALYQGLDTPPVFWLLLHEVRAGAAGRAGRPAQGSRGSKTRSRSAGRTSCIRSSQCSGATCSLRCSRQTRPSVRSQMHWSRPEDSDFERPSSTLRGDCAASGAGRGSSAKESSCCEVCTRRSPSASIVASSRRRASRWTSRTMAWPSGYAGLSAGGEAPSERAAA